MGPLDEEDAFVENDVPLITTSFPSSNTTDADAQYVSYVSSRSSKRTRNRRSIQSSTCLVLACLAVAGGAGVIFGTRRRSSDRNLATQKEQQQIPAAFPVVVRTTFPSVSHADDVLSSLNLDVMGRGRHLSEFGDGSIERDILIHSEADWTTLHRAVSSTRDASFFIDEQHTDLLFLDESSTYTPPPRRNLGDVGVDSTYETMPYRPCYRTVQGTYDTMYDLASQYPHLATVESIGSSYLGEAILMIKLTGPESAQSPMADREPMVITAGVHAREYAPPEIVTRLVEHLTSQYGIDADVTGVLDHTVIHAVLQSNPDSRKIAENNLSDSQPRKNQNSANFCANPNKWGTDLNRNFDFMHGRPGASSEPCHVLYHGKSAASELETKAIENLSRMVFPSGQRKTPNPEADPFGAYSDEARGLYVGKYSAMDPDPPFFSLVQIYSTSLIGIPHY